MGRPREGSGPAGTRSDDDGSERQKLTSKNTTALIGGLDASKECGFLQGAKSPSTNGSDEHSGKVDQEIVCI